MTDQVLKLHAQGKSQREIAKMLGLSQPKVNRILQKVHNQRVKTGDSSSRRVPRAVDAFALAQAQVRFLRTCGATVQNLLDLLEDELPMDHAWKPADVDSLDAHRFTGEEMNGVAQALEQWKRDCRLGDAPC